MARLASTAIAGYFPTPQHLVPLIAGYLQATQEYSSAECCVVDPCAGDGAAVVALTKTLGVRSCFRTCELEQTRHAGLVARIREGYDWSSAQAAIHGDAFQVEFSEGLAGLLFLNPPYDLDPVHGRLEERFLQRFSKTLSEDGVLIFLVPHYALEASAETLAKEFDDLSCLRFPADDFEAYKQVCLFAKKTDTRLLADPAIVAQVKAFASSPTTLPVLGEEAPIYSVPADRRYSTSWNLREMDLLGLLSKAKPWQSSTRLGVASPVPHIIPTGPVQDLMFREFPIATAPRPAHIAAGIASGLFNGRRVNPKSPGLPDLLVKGVFDREFVTIDEKHNKDGDVTGVVQVQQPRLVTTVLDLQNHTYHTLSLGKTGSRNVSRFGIEDLLEHYGPSLLKVMLDQCPVTYDPKRDAEAVSLAPVSRKLFKAQEHASKALFALLGGSSTSPRTRRGKAAVLLGEVGVGKTSVALNVARTITNRMLVLCPPHLLQSWTNETLAVVPEAEVRVLQTVTDVDNLQNVPPEKFLVAILSREAAKLGHGWESVHGACPKCGAPVPPGDLAKQRAHCSSQALRLKDPFAKAAQALALQLAPYAPDNSRIRAILRSAHLQRALDRYQAAEPKPVWKGLDPKWLASTLEMVLPEVLGEKGENFCKLLGRLLLVDYQPDRIIEQITSLTSKTPTNISWYGQNLCRALALLLPPGSALQQEVWDSANVGGYFEGSVKSVQEYEIPTSLGGVRWTDGTLTLDKHPVGSLEMALSVLSKLSAVGKFLLSHECGEPLFQAVPQPRRTALAKYIAKRIPDFFGLLVLDEAHEYASDGSAQSISAHRLTALGLPTILMTGSIMNGYAESLFTNMWAISRDFREEFSREERQSFVTRYGYRKRVVSEKDLDSGKIVAFGSQTDRVERLEHNVGDAPGILPLFLFRHLLKYSVTLHKADLALDLPPCRQIRCEIEADPKLHTSYMALQQALLAAIRKDQYKEGLAGKLFGALAELPSYLDRATVDVGNQEGGSYEIRYPEAVGGQLVATGESFPSSKVLAKEQWMLDTLEAELAEGRNVLVFCWHVGLLPRLARLIEQRTGEKAPILYADKVPTGKRQAWIDTQIVQKGRRVMVANPVCVQTGLNNLVHFSTQIWCENPACNPIVFRQAIGRIDRIGQKVETRVYCPVYKKTLQVQLHDLLLRKVAVSTATDGLDNESVLLAAGASTEGYLTGLSIGRQLWALLENSC